MPGSRGYASCALAGDEIFIFGGYDGKQNYFNTKIVPIQPLDKHHLHRNLANMPGVRGHACCALVGDEIFIFVGVKAPAVIYPRPSPTTLDKYLPKLSRYAGE